MVPAPTIWKMMGHSALLRHHNGQSSGDALVILPGADDDELARFRLLAISGASMTISVTVGFNSRF